MSNEPKFLNSKWKQKDIKYAIAEFPNCSMEIIFKTRKRWRYLRARTSSNVEYVSIYYRERGVTCCELWGNFFNFIKDMGPLPSELHQLDRINNDLGYFKDNCRWVSASVNAANKRSPKKKSGLPRGVEKIGNKYRACICKNKKKYNLGCFDNYIQASEKYNNKFFELWGFYPN